MGEQVTNNDEIIQLKCPVCGKGDFELIYLADKRVLRWQQQYRVKWNKTETYRCLHCDYILMFGRLPK